MCYQMREINLTAPAEGSIVTTVTSYHTEPIDGMTVVGAITVAVFIITIGPKSITRTCCNLFERMIIYVTM